MKKNFVNSFGFFSQFPTSTLLLFMCGSPPGMGFLQFLSYSYFAGGSYESDDHASKNLTTWTVSSYTSAR